MATLWKSCLVQVEESWGLILSAMAFPNARMVEMVSSASPPSASTTMGMKFIPTERQAERCEVSLRWTPTCRAWPGVEAASPTVGCYSGEMMWTSRAAGRPWLQVGRRMSAGLERELGTKLGTSLEGVRAADWAVLKRTSRMAL